MHSQVDNSLVDNSILIPACGRSLRGDLIVPDNATGLVLFAHGSGSSRHSPRNRYVASKLNEIGLGTLLIDLLTYEEEAIDERTRALRFDISMLTDRLVEVIDWLIVNHETEGLMLGIFGASTGAAAAICAATRRAKWVNAVVSRGGRPDLALPLLPELLAPTLLIVGSEDHEVIDLNRHAYAAVQCTKKLVIIPKATHLFEEPGTLDQVAAEASKWFDKYLK